MNTDIVNAIFDMIGAEEWKQIKAIMKGTGATYKGYANFEKVPTQFIKTSCVNHEKTREEFLKAVVETYLNAEAINCDDIPPINNENFIGVVSLMLLKNVDISTIQNAINEMNELSQPENINEEVQTENFKSEGNKMKTYLGYMDGIEEQYYNFFPIYEYNGSEFIKIENTEEAFPYHGNLAVYSRGYYDKETDIKKREFCIINLEEFDITQNINTITGELKSANYKIFIDDIAKDKKLLPLNTYNIYPIVTPVEQEIDFSKDTIIDVKEEFPVFKYMTQSVLYYKGDYYGPFTTGYRQYNKKVYINTKISEKSYLIDRYTIVDNTEDPILYCKLYKSEDYQDFLVINDALEKATIDYANDDILISTFTELLKSNVNTNDINIENLPEVLNKIKNLPLADIPNQPEISQKRLARFNSIFSNVSKVKELSDVTSALVQNMFVDSDDEKKNAIVESIINNPDFLNRIQNYRIVASKIAEKKEEAEELQRKILELQENIKSTEENIREDVLADLDEKRLELDNLKREVSENQTKLNEITEKLGIAQDTEELETLHTHYSTRYQILERKINNKIEEARNAATEISFDDEFDKMISLKMSEAFSKYQRSTDNEVYEKIADRTSNIVVQPEDKSQLIARIVEEVQKYRPTYDKNTILNIVICMTQGFLTILSGAPGTGKTSICKIVAHILGLDAPLCEDVDDIFTSRFSLISVERGWNSKRDLIGYYNPLSKRIERSNSDLYDSLKILNAEKSKSKYPMVVLLDEANLSPMEYYWADFVNISDDIDKNIPKNLDLGDGQKISIPTTLRFLATINNDHTTENISPRLIDRAFVISLPSLYSDKAKDDFDDSCIITDWESLKNTFAASGMVMETQANSIYEKIKDFFTELKQPISPRVERSVTSYCSVAQNIFESKDNIAPSIVALDYAVSQKLITKISGNGSVYKDALNKLNTFCKEQNLNLTAQQLDRIIDHGKDMDYYEYFC